MSYLPIYDRAQEGCKSFAQGLKYTNEILQDIEALQTLGHMPCMFALKYSSFYPLTTTRPNVARIAKVISVLQGTRNVRAVLFDAEGTQGHSLEQKAMEQLLPLFNREHVFLYKTYQMYRRDGLDTLVRDMQTHPKLGVKLVRGAYHHQDARTGALFLNKADTDHAYNTALAYVIQKVKEHPSHVQLLVATHNDTSLEIAAQQLRQWPHVRDSIAFAQLLGMHEMASARLRNEGFRHCAPLVKLPVTHQIMCCFCISFTRAVTTSTCTALPMYLRAFLRLPRMCSGHFMRTGNP